MKERRQLKLVYGDREQGDGDRYWMFAILIICAIIRTFVYAIHIQRCELWDETDGMCEWDFPCSLVDTCAEGTFVFSFFIAWSIGPLGFFARKFMAGISIDNNSFDETENINELD